MNKSGGLGSLIRNFLFSIVNKEFLIFLFFLALSAIFWLQMTLNETYEKEYRIAVRLTGVPKNVVLTSDEYDTVKVTLKDKGLQLLYFNYAQNLPKISVNFSTYAQADGHGAVPAADIQKLVYQQLPASTKITSVKPERMEFFYNYGLHKKVPVRWMGNVVPESPCFISHVVYQPDSVDVYATRQRLDSITEVHTEPLNCTNFRDTLHIVSRTERIRGAKIVPNKVAVSFITDILTEEQITDIPIRGIHLPKGKVLRTFPSKADVSFVAGVNLFRKLSKNDFSIVVDYNEIAMNPSDKCPIHLKVFPSGISHAKLSVQMVDYLIEEETEDAEP